MTGMYRDQRLGLRVIGVIIHRDRGHAAPKQAAALLGLESGVTLTVTEIELH